MDKLWNHVRVFCKCEIFLAHRGKGGKPYSAESRSLEMEKFFIAVSRADNAPDCPIASLDKAMHDEGGNRGEEKRGLFIQPCLALLRSGLLGFVYAT